MSKHIPEKIDLALSENNLKAPDAFFSTIDEIEKFLLGASSTLTEQIRHADEILDKLKDVFSDLSTTKDQERLLYLKEIEDNLYDLKTNSARLIVPKIEELLKLIKSKDEFNDGEVDSSALSAAEPDFPETIELNENELNSIKDNIEVLLVTATNVECNAAAQFLAPLEGHDKILEYADDDVYYIGKMGVYTAALMQCLPGTVGLGSASTAIPAAIRLFNPHAVIMVGILCGRDPSKQKVGDVLVASKVIPYERVRFEPDGQVTFDGPIPQSSQALLSRFINARNWKHKLPDGRFSKKEICSILSGNTLLDNPQRKEQLFRTWNARGIEMEGASLWLAAESGNKPWILVKAISDWGDGKKRDSDTEQYIAAAAAADLVNFVLSKKSALKGCRK